MRRAASSRVGPERQSAVAFVPVSGAVSARRVCGVLPPYASRAGRGSADGLDAKAPFGDRPNRGVPRLVAFHVGVSSGRESGQLVMGSMDADATPRARPPVVPDLASPACAGQLADDKASA